MDTEHHGDSGLGWLLGWAFFVFLVILGAYLAVELLPSEYFGGVDRVRIVSERISGIGREAWQFGRPILQLVLVLVIFEWLLKRAGLSLDLTKVRFSEDIRAVLWTVTEDRSTAEIILKEPGDEAVRLSRRRRQDMFCHRRLSLHLGERVYSANRW
jgi:hypothetical protein